MSERHEQMLEFWSTPERVEQFADRPVDHRLKDLVELYESPPDTTVLDLGCAGGRNLVFLAERGFDVYATDLSPAMIDRSRGRASQFLPEGEVEERVRVGAMDDLAAFESESIDLVVALGVYQLAQSEAEWRASLSETRRLLAPGGRCLVATFGPGTGPVDNPPKPVPESEFLYEGMRFGRGCLLSVEQLDAEFARFSLVPEVPTRLVEKQEDGRYRNTVNGLYRLDRATSSA